VLRATIATAIRDARPCEPNREDTRPRQRTTLGDLQPAPALAATTPSSGCQHRFADHHTQTCGSQAIDDLLVAPRALAPPRSRPPQRATPCTETISRHHAPRRGRVLSRRRRSHAPAFPRTWASPRGVAAPHKLHRHARGLIVKPNSHFHHTAIAPAGGGAPPQSPEAHRLAPTSEVPGPNSRSRPSRYGVHLVVVHGGDGTVSGSSTVCSACHTPSKGPGAYVAVCRWLSANVAGTLAGHFRPGRANLTSSSTARRLTPPPTCSRTALSPAVRLGLD